MSEDSGEGSRRVGRHTWYTLAAVLLCAGAVAVALSVGGNGSGTTAVPPTIGNHQTSTPRCDSSDGADGACSPVTTTTSASPATTSTTSAACSTAVAASPGCPSGASPKPDTATTSAGHSTTTTKTTTTASRSTTPAPTTTTTSSGADCGGSPPAESGVGSAWTCTFDDEFDASTGDASSLNLSKWTIQETADSGYSTGESPYEPCYGNDPSDVTVSNGSLNLLVEEEPSQFACPGLADSLVDTTQFTAGMVTTVDSFSQEYGLFEVRAKIPAATAPGLQETLWLEPVNQKLYGAEPASGEIDFAEFFSDYANEDYPTIHYSGNSDNENVSTGTNVYTNDTGANMKACVINVGQFNVYAVRWSPGTITTYYNGQPCFTDNYAASNVASPAPFNQPFFLSLTQALGANSPLGLFGPNNEFVPGSTPTSATTNIDYVRVWQSKS